MRSCVKLLVTSLCLVAMGAPAPSVCQSKMFYLQNVDGTNSRLLRGVYPVDRADNLITGRFTSAAVDPATALAYVVESGNISVRSGTGLQAILLYAGVTEGFTIDGGTRNFIFIGGSSVRTLYTMGLDKKVDGRYPDPKPLISFSDTVTPRQVATLDSQQVFWSQADGDGSSSIYQIGIQGGAPVRIHTQVDGSEEGRSITALAVDSLNRVLYFCQKGSTSVVKALPLSSTTPSTLLTYDGECNSLAVEGRNGNLYVAGAPNNGGPGLAVYRISNPSTYTRFSNGEIVRSVSLAVTSIISKPVTPVAPIVSTVGSKATIYFERFKTVGNDYHKREGYLKYPNGRTKTFDPPLTYIIFDRLKKGTYTVKNRVIFTPAGKKDSKSSYSKTTRFRIQ